MQLISQKWLKFQGHKILTIIYRIRKNISGRITVFYLGNNGPRPTHLRGKAMILMVFLVFQYNSNDLCRFSFRMLQENGIKLWKRAIMTWCYVTDFPNLPKYKLLWSQLVLFFINKPLGSFRLVGKCKIGHCYPKINACHRYFQAVPTIMG